MAHTSHGHYIFGSYMTEDDMPNIRLAKNCGGMNFCSDCQAEGQLWLQEHPQQAEEVAKYKADVKDAKFRHPSSVKPDMVNHPEHYGSADDPYEVIKVIKAWDLGFHLGNTVKYIGRVGKKDPKKAIEDLEKGAWYLQDYINWLKEKNDEH